MDRDRGAGRRYRAAARRRTIVAETDDDDDVDDDGRETGPREMTMSLLRHPQTTTTEMQI